MGNIKSKKEIHTIADIARIAGVSKSTVSRALSESPLIGVETRARIQKIARENNFQINMPARRLSLKQSNTIAFVTHANYMKFSAGELFVMELLGGVTGELKQQGYDLLMLFVDPCDENWARQHLNTGRADGFILVTSSRKNSHIQMLHDIGAPFIAWGYPNEKFDFSTVSGDDRTGGRLATEHLLALGRKKIAFIGGPPMEKEVKNRYQGYLDALEAAGMEPSPAMIAHGDYSDASGAEMTRKLLDANREFDAMFVTGDLMAIAAMQTIQESGRRVPEDVAIVGYDNLWIAEKTNPALTTISQNIHLAGTLLSRNLLQTIQSGVVTHVTVPVELIKRNSA